MRFTSFLIFMLLSIQVFTEGSVIPEVKIIRLPDPCGDNKTFIVGLYAGVMNPEDNLFGFEYELTYSKETLLYNGALTNSSFAQFFEGEFSGFTSGSSNDTLYGEGGIITSNPLVGDRNLIALSFEYIGEPNDSVFINYNYLYMYDEFSNTITLTDDSHLKSKIVPQSFMSAELIVADSLNFEEDLTSRLDIQLSSQNGSELKDLHLTATFSDLYQIEDIIFNTNVSSSFNLDNEKLNLFFQNLDQRDNDIIASIFLIQNQNSNIISDFDISVSSFNYNSCIKKMDDVKTVLKPFNSLSISKSIKTIKNIVVYNLLGQTVYNGKDIQKANKYRYCIQFIEYQNGSKEKKYLIN